jgi:hypothetical protein
MSDAAAIRDLVRRLNSAWVGGRFEELDGIFHDDMVSVAPDFVHRLIGRAASVQSYRDFLSQAVVNDFNLDEPDVDVFGDAAVASCPYTITYDMGGKRWRGSGRDLLVLVRRSPGWSVVWRTLLAGPEEEVLPDTRTEQN